MQVENGSPFNPAETPVLRYLQLLGSADPVPGGASAAALTGAQGASLVAMLARWALRRSEQEEEAAARLEQLAHHAGELVRQLSALATEEAEAYHQVMRAYRLPRASERERGSRSEAVRQALARAAEVPLRAVRASVEGLELLAQLLPSLPQTALPDAGTAGWLLRACVEGGALHVRSGWQAMGPEASETWGQLERLVGRSRRLFDELRERLGHLSNGGSPAGMP